MHSTNIKLIRSRYREGEPEEGLKWDDLPRSGSGFLKPGSAGPGEDVPYGQPNSGRRIPRLAATGVHRRTVGASFTLEGGLMSRRSHPGRVGRIAFFAAGLLMLIQVALIGLRRFGVSSVSELWAAPPAIAGIVASIVGLVALHPALASGAPRLARAGQILALGAGVIFGVAAASFIVLIVLSDGAPLSMPPWIQGAVALFMIAYVGSFVLSGAASLRSEGMRRISLPLFVPVAAWGVILIAAVISNLSGALQLDVYTNVAIAFSFITIGSRL